jgi:hypothetical protein
MESTIQGSVEESVWHIVPHSLKIEGTCKSHKSSKEASSESGCVLLLQVFSDDNSSLIFEKISIFIEFVGGYPVHRS